MLSRKKAICDFWRSPYLNGLPTPLPPHTTKQINKFSPTKRKNEKQANERKKEITIKGVLESSFPAHSHRCVLFSSCTLCLLFSFSFVHMEPCIQSTVFLHGLPNASARFSVPSSSSSFLFIVKIHTLCHKFNV